MARDAGRRGMTSRNTAAAPTAEADARLAPVPAARHHRAMVDTPAFDTLATTRKLKAAGIADTHSEASAAAIRAARGDLATRADFRRGMFGLAAFTVAVAALSIGLMQLSR